MKVIFWAAFTVWLMSCQSGKRETEKDLPVNDSSAVSSGLQNPPASDSFNLHTLGNIALQQPYLETVKALGEPDKKTKAVEWGADGLMHEDWTWKNQGLELNMSSEKNAVSATLSVFSITASTPCSLKTKAGIGIGSTYEETVASYQNHINANESSRDQVVIGTVYGGIIFTFTHNKVSRIFLGAAAE